MKYYRMIDENQFIGVISSDNFKRYNPISKLLLSSGETRGEYVRYDKKLYRDYWMAPTKTDDIKYKNVRIIEITEEEYNALNSIIESELEIPSEYTEEEESVQLVVPIINEDEVITLDAAKASKIKVLSAQCRATIENGFDLELDNTIHHFSLDTQDQLNLITLSVMAETENEIPYHADGELCKFYSASEIKAIVTAANQHKIYQTTYYNALKGYVNDLDNLEDIAAVTYGMELPTKYKTEVLRSI